MKSSIKKIIFMHMGIFGHICAKVKERFTELGG